MIIYFKRLFILIWIFVVVIAVYGQENSGLLNFDASFRNGETKIDPEDLPYGCQFGDYAHLKIESCIPDLHIELVNDNVIHGIRRFDDNHYHLCIDSGAFRLKLSAQGFEELILEEHDFWSDETSFLLVRILEQDETKSYLRFTDSYKNVRVELNEKVLEHNLPFGVLVSKDKRENHIRYISNDAQYIFAERLFVAEDYIEEIKFEKLDNVYAFDAIEIEHDIKKYEFDENKGLNILLVVNEKLYGPSIKKENFNQIIKCIEESFRKKGLNVHSKVDTGLYKQLFQNVFNFDLAGKNNINYLLDCKVSKMFEESSGIKFVGEFYDIKKKKIEQIEPSILNSDENLCLSIDLLLKKYPDIQVPFIKYLCYFSSAAMIGGLIYDIFKSSDNRKLPDAPAFP